MRWFSLSGRRGRAAARPDDGARAGPVDFAPYSPQYEVIVGQGHDHPTPFFSPPALVWHVGIWPKKSCDPHDNGGATGQGASAKDAYKSIHDREAAFTRRRTAWVRAIDRQLAAMQRARRPADPPNATKQFIKPVGEGEGAARVPDSGSVVFTMWWRAPQAAEGADDEAIRVKVHCNLTPDYVSYSFYMDVATRWGAPFPSLDGGSNANRARILEAVESVRRICEAERDAGARYAQVHPDTLSAQEDAALLGARNLLYVDAWENFIADTGCSLAAMAGELGEVFANFRGVVLGVGKVDGIEPATSRFPRFSEDPRFDVDGTEANAVVDAYWPLVRRIVPEADFREFVVCGLLGWRALYVTALGSPSQYDAHEERAPTRGEKAEADMRVHAGPGPAPADVPTDSCVRPQSDGARRNHPVRYLMLTKENLNPRQLGRIVERINALGTLRLYALKDWSRIVEADTKIRVLGQELDLVTKDWSDKRRLLDSLGTFGKIVKARTDPTYAQIKPYITHVEIPGWFTRTYGAIKDRLWRLGGQTGEFVRREEASKLLDFKYGALAEISSELEGKLIAIGAEIDRLSLEATGGLHFRISRSSIHVAEFYQLLELLQVGNMQTWTSYEQFVKRGLAPTFKSIEEVGRRIVALRTRLTSVLETIETSALVGQSSATRHNTAQLRRIAVYGMLLLFFYLARPTFQFAQRLVERWPEYYALIRTWLGW
ncbi:MAG: hypothetical protein EKK41_16135 [Hyphomicrobiales bacterium]|nr:MAG: hypothetical protein EKK41_16135 [Hyphomicrobiales bacterium]